MNKITIIFGPRNSGKTAKIGSLIKFKNAVILNHNELDNHFFPEYFTPDIEIIAIDDISELTESLKVLISSVRLTVHRQYRWPFTIETPDIVFSTKNLDLINSDFIQDMIKRNIEIIHLKEN